MNHRYLKGSENSVERVELDIEKPNGDTVACTVNVDLLLCGVYIFPCEDGTDAKLTLEQKRDILVLVTEEREKIINEVTIKSRQSWHDSGLGTFNEYFLPGDTVAEDVVDYFMDIVPPVVLRKNLLQVGEAHNYEFDPEKGKMRSTFATFYKAEGEWKFAGYCFLGETKNRVTRPGRIAEKLAEVEHLIQKK
ncbi:MAG: hypothetical protein IJX94_01205 [Clostridia bacterium]|nr:hypothetical protein [Clostridia bacterium]